jgi:hypothetical protein
MSITPKHVHNEAQCANTEGCNSDRLEDPVVESRQWERIPSSLKVQTGPEAHIATYSLYTGVRPPGEKQPGRHVQY